MGESRCYGRGNGYQFSDIHDKPGIFLQLVFMVLSNFFPNLVKMIESVSLTQVFFFNYPLEYGFKL